MSRHRYRDAAILYGVLALVIVGLALLTNGDMVRAVVVALVFWVLATWWSWRRLRSREEAEAAEQQEEEDA